MMTWRDEADLEEDLAEQEYVDDSEVDDSESLDSQICPGCGSAIYPDVALCPRCGIFLEEDRTIHRQPLWILIGVAICVLIVAMLWLR